MLCKSKFFFWGFLTHYFFLSLLGVSLFGCATGPKGSRILGKTKPKEVVAINSGVNERHRKEYEGSLWKDDGPLSELFMNPKARRVGDIVTISIVESSSASNNATTNTERASSLSAGMENFFGLESRYPSSHPFFNPFSGVKGDLESAFAGKGTTTRSGDLTAYISARVIEELPNGNLKILGSREVTVNNETQIIALSGIVRPRDISPDNVILSTYISDARITYSGTGIVNDRQGPGWLARIFDTIWPF